MEDLKYNKGFKFDHVWNIVKHFEKFQDNVATQRNISRKHGVNYLSSDSENPTPESQSVASAGLSGFEINLNKDIGGSSSERPCGVKKAKIKRKNDDKLVRAINNLQEENRKLSEMLMKSNAEKMELKSRSLALKELKEENKILMMDLSTINDPNVRAYIEAQKAQILQKRGQFQQPPPSTSNSFGCYFNNISRDGADLPEY